MDYAVNELMRSMWDAVRDPRGPVVLAPEVRRIVRKGLTRDRGRIDLRAYARRRRKTAAAMDRLSAERWVNDVHLESALAAADPAWRADVLSQAVGFVRQVLPGFAALAAVPVQAVIGLQSAPGREDPEMDFPVGSVHLYQLGHADADARRRIETDAQPILVITCDDHRYRLGRRRLDRGSPAPRTQGTLRFCRA